MQTDSLRRQLLKRLLWPLSIILFSGSLFAYFFALHSAVNAYDLGLLNDAVDISKQIEVRDGMLTLDLPPAARQMLLTNNQDRVNYAAWDGAGKVFSGNPKLQIADTLNSDESHVFQDIELSGEAQRAILFRGKAEGKLYYITVAQTLHGRDHLAGGIFAGILIPETMLALVSIAVILLGVRSGLSPVELLRDEISSRSSNDLRPIEEMTAPSELAPIIHGINDLLKNLSAAFASHRRFIADAAHQLRTPLAGLSSQIEVALATPPADEKKLLQQLLATTQRTTHLANQLLSLARLEHTEQFMYEVVRVDLEAVLLESAADFVTLGARKGVELEFDLQSCVTRGSPLMLRELISNLLDNAVRYTQPGGRVRVSLQCEGAPRLIIEDNGPGVPKDELARLGTPFHRLPNEQIAGCGLGLAIVREIARLHGAKIAFARGADGQGLRVSINFHTEPALNVEST
jgi:two-component system sensor histidine kinase TctE